MKDVHPIRDNVALAASTAARVDRTELMERYGVRYFAPGTRAIAEAAPDNLYHYRTFIGPHTVEVERGDSVFWLGPDLVTAQLSRGPTSVRSEHIATIIRGYMPENRSTSITQRTTLPYVNGCSTKQLFAPERPGDPTLQLLMIPPHSSEQAHHLHSTVRVAYILRGHGVSVVGMEGGLVREELVPGKVAILEPMCPHHFETRDEPLVCVPLHVFSSVGPAELRHPMYTGTHLLDP